VANVHNLPGAFAGAVLLDKKTGAAALSVASNSLLIILKVVVGLVTGSVAVISEAIHSGMDLLAALIALFAVRASGRAADEEHPFGHGKFENIAGSIEALRTSGHRDAVLGRGSHGGLGGGELRGFASTVQGGGGDGLSCAAGRRLASAHRRIYLGGRHAGPTRDMARGVGGGWGWR